MANKKYFTDESLATFVDEVKAYTDESVAGIKSGTVVVKEAEHATSANTANTANSATNATSATKAAQDASGNVITSTYETKNDASAKLTEAKTYTDTVASGKADSNHNHDTKYDAKGSASAVQTNLNTVSDTLDAHTGNSDVHVTTTNKSNWNTAYTHSQATHARTDATKVADSTTNGNILINGTETNVYSHPNSGVTAGTYKSVTVNAQGHVTGGTNPTTLSGYGITDAESKGAASAALASAKEYTDSVASGKADSNHNHDTKYDSKGAANTALASAKEYADNVATTAANAVKNDLLNGAGTAYDTLKELGDLIDDNKDAIDALESVAAGKANATHSHAISDVTNLQSTLDGKADATHGTHVTFDSTNKPKMDGTAAFGTATTVSRSDHVHPTDTSRASKTEFDTHVSDTTVHITSTERSNWNAAKTHADSAHAPSNAEKNQNAFSNIAVSGQTTVAADTATDTVTFAGSNVSITTDATNDKVTFSVADGTTSAKGVVKLTNSTSSTSTTTAATPSSVKSAYDLANTAKTNAATAQTRADAAYSLAESKVDSLSDLGITATATELNYIDGVTSNIQTQLDGKAATHSHPYAGSSAQGGAATSANKLNTDAGSTTQPVYFANGVPVKTTYTLGKSVPSDAKFTDTTYSEATQSVAGLLSAADKTQLDYGGIPIVTASSTDGATYTATVDGMSALTVGMSLIIVPSTASTNTAPKLNVNSLGAKTIRMPIAYNTSLTAAGPVTGWLVANKPITVQWNGTYWVTSGFSRPSAQYLYGTVPVGSGGTGATDAATARTNLEVYSKTEADTAIANASEVFIATFNTTTYAEIKAAVDAGKVCFCKNGVSIAPLYSCNSSSAIFYLSTGNGFMKYSVSGRKWDNMTIYRFASLSGATMEGALTLKADPTEALQAATKQYVDNKYTSETWTFTLSDGSTTNKTVVLA